MKIKMKKCVGVSFNKEDQGEECVGYVAKCVEESREREKRNVMFWNESGRNGSSLVKMISIKKSQK